MKYMSLFPLKVAAMISSTCSEEVFFEKKPQSILGCPSTSMIYDERKKLESSGHGIYRRLHGPRAKVKHEEEHEDSKKERNARTTSYYTENHKTTSLV
jgi:hypothetical protein